MEVFGVGGDRVKNEAKMKKGDKDVLEPIFLNNLHYRKVGKKKLFEFNVWRKGCIEIMVGTATRLYRGYQVV